MSTIRILIDTDKEKIIVPDSFFNQIDKINKNIELGGGTKIEYTDFVKTQFEKCIANPIVRKSDI